MNETRLVPRDHPAGGIAGRIAGRLFDLADAVGRHLAIATPRRSTSPRATLPRAWPIWRVRPNERGWTDFPSLLVVRRGWAGGAPDPSGCVPGGVSSDAPSGTWRNRFRARVPGPALGRVPAGGFLRCRRPGPRTDNLRACSVD